MKTPTMQLTKVKSNGLRKSNGLSNTNGSAKTFPLKVAPTADEPNKLALSRRLKDVGFRAANFLVDAGLGKQIIEYPKASTIFSQGDSADSVFYIQKGKVKIGVVSAEGKEATVAVLTLG